MATQVEHFGRANYEAKEGRKKATRGGDGFAIKGNVALDRRR